MEQEPTLDLTVNFQNLLWHTRGRYWDYEFVSIPKDPELSSWWLVLQQVFRGTESNTESIFRYGELPLSPRRPFLAAAYQDPKLRDAFNRPIAHRVMWFPDSDRFDAVKKSLPEDWAVQIIDVMGPWFESEAVFNLAKEQIQERSKLSNGLGAYFCEHSHTQQEATSCKLRVAPPSSPKRWTVVEVEICPSVVMPAIQTHSCWEPVKDEEPGKSWQDRLPPSERMSKQESHGLSSEPLHVETKPQPRPSPGLPVSLRAVSALLLVLGLPVGYLAFHYLLSPPPPPLEAALTKPAVPVPCTGSACNVRISCNLAESSGNPCANRIRLFVGLSGDGPSPPPVDTAPGRAQRPIKFADGVANVPSAQTAEVKLTLTPKGKDIAKIKRGKKLKGMLEIRNTAGTIISNTAIKIRLR